MLVSPAIGISSGMAAWITQDALHTYTDFHSGHFLSLVGEKRFAGEVRRRAFPSEPLPPRCGVG